MAGDVPERLTARYQIVRLVVWTVIFLIFFPPIIIIGLSLENQESVTFSVEDFYISGNSSTNASSSNESAIYFNIIIKNGGFKVRAYYDKFNLTFSHYNASGGVVAVGSYTIPEFKQGSGKTTERNGYVVMNAGSSWSEITKNVSGVVFRVDLSGAVKFRDIILKAKRKKLKIMASADVEVDRNTGKKISKEDIVFKHLNIHHDSGWTVAAFVIVILAFVCLPCWLCPLAICCKYFWKKACAD